MSTADELLALLKRHEDNLFERKLEGVRDSELRQTCTAFANSTPLGRFAVLVVGVHDRTGEIVGVTNPDQMQKRIGDVCHDDCYPPIRFESHVIEVEGKRVVAVVIPGSESRPHFAGPAYVRAGSESIKATERLYQELIETRLDKVREIRRHTGVFTVEGVGYKTGTNRILGDSKYRETRQCRLIECNAHSAIFEDISTNDRFVEPLSRIELSVDLVRRQPLLIVTFAAK